MQLKTLEIEGFKSFKKKQTFTFPAEPGLYYLGGKNLVDSDLDSNGAGKSSFLDAVCWVFYGKTSVGLKASDAASWNRDFPCRGVLSFNKEGTLWNIARTWSPNSLKVWKGDEKPEIWAQDAVDDLIGLNLESYLRTILFSQFGTHFFDLKPAEKTKILTPILNLGIWERCSEIASSNRSQMQGSLNDTRISLSETQGYLVGLQEKDFAEDLKDWQDAFELKESALKDLLKGKLKEFKELKEKVKEALSEKEEIEELKLEYREGKASIVSKQKAYREDKERHFSSKASLLAEIKGIEKELLKLDSLVEEGTCVRCGQEIDGQHIEEESAPLFENLELKSGELEEEIKVLATFDDGEILLAKELEEFELQGMSLFDADKENATILSRYKTLTLGVNTEIGKAKIELGKLQDAVNPFVWKQRDLEERLKQAAAQVETYEKEVLGLQEAESRLAYWVAGFKKLRLFVMREILSQFSMEVNNSLQVLGLSGWEIVLQLDKENKSGTIKNEFTVFVKGPENTEFANWESWSGGERQRLRFAGDLGLANLIKSSKGVAVDFEFYDEPSNFLSGSGIKGEVEVLKERALSGGKTIFLIDHKNMEDFEFTGRFTIVKDAEGSRFD